MYLPEHFEETRVDILHQLFRERSLATLVTLGSTGLNANHIPFELAVVPTDNYTAVHAYGRFQIIEGPDWLHGLVSRLTAGFEAARPQSWQVTDAPDEFIKKHLRAIVGIEITVTKLLGKWKASQNRLLADREGVVKGLSESNDADSLALAELVRERNKM